ncbi:MAG: SGNH/GDSL hydrolase family protein [Caulobacterales bacterium]
MGDGQRRRSSAKRLFLRRQSFRHRQRQSRHLRRARRRALLPGPVLERPDLGGCRLASICGRPAKDQPRFAGSILKTSAGYSFAHAGSVSNYANLNAEQALGFKPPGFSLRLADPFVLIGQAKHFRDQKVVFGGRVFQAGPDDVATISAGGNDYINAKASPTTTVPSIIEAMRIIQQRNITKFLVLDLPPLGEIPAKFGGAEQTILNTKSAQHNRALTAAVRTFSAQTGARVEIVPLSGVFAAVKNDIDTNGGARFGFKIGRPGPGTKGNCLEDGLRGAACPRTYVFYDGEHPTTAMHNLIGRAAVARLIGSAAIAGATVSRVVALNQSSLQLNRLVAARITAASDGGAMSGLYVNGARGFAAEGGLGFVATPQRTAGLNVFRYVAGAAPGLEGIDETFLTQSDLGRGEYVSGFGADTQLTDHLFLGAMTITALRDDPSPWAQRTNKSHASAVYGLWSEAGNRFGLKLEQGRANQDLARYTGLEEAPTAFADAHTDYVTLRFDAARDAQMGNFTLGGRGAISATRLNQAAYQETADYDFLARAAPARSDSGAAMYFGVSASRDAALGQFWRASFNLEGGVLAASSDRVGFSALLDAPLMRGSDQNLRFFAPDEKLATEGALMRARFGLAGRSGFALDAQVDRLFDNRGGATAGTLRAMHRF